MRTFRRAGAHRVLVFTLAIGCDAANRPHGPGPDAGLDAVNQSPTLAAPGGFTATAASATRVDVAWQDNATEETGFEIYGAVTGLSSFALHATTGPGVTSWSFTGLDAGREYCHKARAYLKKGKRAQMYYSDFSNVACATTSSTAPMGPEAPSATTVVLRMGEIVDVSWTDNADDEDGFYLERSAASTGPWERFHSFGPNYPSSSFVVTIERQVCYRVLAFNSLGVSLPSNADCTTPPAQPSGLTATGASGPAVDLLWRDNSSAEDGFELRRRSTASEPWSTIADLPSNATAHRDVGVTGDLTYEYHVRARKDGGFSYASEIVRAAVASAPPAAPSDPRGVPLSSTVVSVGWTDNSTNEEGFRLERSTDDGASWVVAARPDSGLVPEVRVCYRVIAFNARGESEPSNVGCTTPPAGPTGESITPIDAETLDFTWADRSSVEDGYEIWILDGWTLGKQFLTRLPANSTSFRSGPGAYWYQYHVVAIKDGGYSDFSGGVWSDPP